MTHLRASHSVTFIAAIVSMMIVVMIVVMVPLSARPESIAKPDDETMRDNPGKPYRHKFMFTEKARGTSMCIRIVARPMKSLSVYKKCSVAKPNARHASVALTDSIAKCEKGDGTVAFIFETLDQCSAAKVKYDAEQS